MTTSLHVLQQRLTAVESRLAEIEGGYGATRYRLHRDLTGVKLDLRKLLSQAGLSATTEADIDAALDESS